ncbi:unnamed protein product [Linum trigynum]|uniref:Uncharacterized protein n=1 Tax=Linum trigynum TaxID=586398 RepID=A0AAV2E981_9ROSI
MTSEPCFSISDLPSLVLVLRRTKPSSSYRSDCAKPRILIALPSLVHGVVFGFQTLIVISAVGGGAWMSGRKLDQKPRKKMRRGFLGE